MNLTANRSEDAEEGTTNLTQLAHHLGSQDEDSSWQVHKSQSADCHSSAIGSKEDETVISFGCDCARESSLVTEVQTVFLSDEACASASIENSLAGKMMRMTVDNTGSEEASSTSVRVRCCALEEDKTASAGASLETISLSDSDLAAERGQEKGGEYGDSDVLVNFKTANTNYVLENPSSGEVVNSKTANNSVVLGDPLASENILYGQEICIRESAEKESSYDVIEDEAEKVLKVRDERGETEVIMPIARGKAGMAGMLEVYLPEDCDGALLDRKVESNLPACENDTNVESELEVPMINAEEDRESDNKLEVNMENAEEDLGVTCKLEATMHKEGLIQLETYDRCSIQEVESPVQQILFEDGESIKNNGRFVNCGDKLKVLSFVCACKNLTGQVAGDNQGTQVQSRIEEVSDLVHDDRSINNREINQEEKVTNSDFQEIYSEVLEVDRRPLNSGPGQRHAEVRDDVKTHLETTGDITPEDVCGPTMEVVQILGKGSNCLEGDVMNEITDVVQDGYAGVELSGSNISFVAKPEEVTEDPKVAYAGTSNFMPNSTSHLSQVGKTELEGEETESGNLEGILSTNLADSIESCMESDTQAIEAETLKAKLDSLGIFLETSNSSGSLDQHIVDTESCLALHNMEHPGSIDISNSSCKDNASVHLRVQTTINANKKRIDLGHQFVREIVKIQHSREQHKEKQQTSKQENQHCRKLDKINVVGKINQAEDGKQNVSGVYSLNARMSNMSGPVHTEGSDEREMSVTKSVPAAGTGVVCQTVSKSNTKASVYFPKADSVGENEFGRKEFPSHEVNRVRDRKLSTKGKASPSIATAESEGGMHFARHSPLDYGKEPSHDAFRNNRSISRGTPAQSSKHQRGWNRSNAFHIREDEAGRSGIEEPVYWHPTVKSPSAPSTNYETNAYFDEWDGGLGRQDSSRLGPHASSGPCASGSKSQLSNAACFESEGIFKRRSALSADSVCNGFSNKAVEAEPVKLPVEKRSPTNNRPRFGITECSHNCGVPGEAQMKDVNCQALQLISQSTVAKSYTDAGRGNSGFGSPLPNAHKIMIEDANKFVVNIGTTKQERRIGYLKSRGSERKGNAANMPSSEFPFHKLSKESVYHGETEPAGTVPNMVPAAVESSFESYQSQAAFADEHFGSTIQKQGLFGRLESRGGRRHTGKKFRDEAHRISKGDRASKHILNSLSIRSSAGVKDTSSSLLSCNDDDNEGRSLEVFGNHESSEAIVHDEFEESWSSPSFPINSLPKVKSMEVTSSKPRRWGDVDEGEEMEFGPLNGGNEQNFESEGRAKHDPMVSGATDNIQSETLHPRQLVYHSETNSLPNPRERKYFTDHNWQVESGMVIEHSSDKLLASVQSSVRKSVWERLGPREVAVDMPSPSNLHKPIDAAGKTPPYRSFKFDKANKGSTSRGCHVDRVMETRFHESNVLSPETLETAAKQAHKDDKPRRGKVELYVPRRSSRKY